MAAQHANQRTPDGTPPEDVEEHEQLNDDAPVRANFGAGTRRPRTGAFSVSTRSSRGAMYDLRVGPLVITLADQSAQEMTQGKTRVTTAFRSTSVGTQSAKTNPHHTNLALPDLTWPDLA